MASHRSTGSFHHVIVLLKGSDKKAALFTDLTAAELKRRFVRPYKQGKPVLLPDNSVVQTRDITWTTIRATAEAAAPTLEALEAASRRNTDELNRGGGVVFLGRFSWGNEDLAEEGQDVTSRYIQAPPGEDSLYRRLGSWLADNLGKAGIALLLTVASAVVLTWLGLKK
ncbi:hypothetical protein [Stenotrophomonas maltophilia]|jgi:hypothetical protein|uniref:Uncharacterized protein n=1 Tax=Stenotrophomonas maltophilia TaxID=40324 RepID=A0AAP7GYF1_STEMA|nr:hypothetical protein [Stenotrophomonas maltophilia]KOQ70079.1 hypothetical protein ABW43_06860 [Stenotrophomonas maltophilia]OBU63199.1 hypothetical protein A9K56_00330 [Stenotrophomonas maltophilia]